MAPKDSEGDSGPAVHKHTSGTGCGRVADCVHSYKGQCVHEGLRKPHLVLDPTLAVTGSGSSVPECQLSEYAGREEPVAGRLLPQCARKSWRSVGSLSLSRPPNLYHRLLSVDSRERPLLTACSNKVPGRQMGRQVLEFISGKAGVCLSESK